MRDAMARLFPFPCRSRYTSLSMVPSAQGLLGVLRRGMDAVREASSSEEGRVKLALGVAASVATVTALALALRWGAFTCPADRPGGSAYTDASAPRPSKR